MKRVNLTGEYRDNFTKFFRLLDREAMKWGETLGADYKMSYQTGRGLFDRAWALNGCDGEPWISTFVYATLLKCDSKPDPARPWILDFEPLNNFLEERYSELTFDPSEMTDEELEEFAEFKDGDKYDFRYAWIDEECKYEAWDAWHQTHRYD